MEITGKGDGAARWLEADSGVQFSISQKIPLVVQARVKVVSFMTSTMLSVAGLPR